MNKIHGETRIVLRNPISGNILKDVTSENTFQTSVMAQAVRSLGGLCSPYYNDTVRNNEPWKTIVGGIFLFRDTINVGDLYMSAGNQMVGNGAWNITNAADPSELGTFNSQESSQSASAITQVYDFATNQANGRISCVCLTSQTGGYIGYGNMSGQTTPTKWVLNRNQDIKGLNPQFTGDNITYEGVNYRYDYKMRRMVRGNKEYFFILTTDNKLLVREYTVPTVRASVFDGMYKDTVIDISSLHYTFMNSRAIQVSLDTNGKFYITSRGERTITTGATEYIWEYDPVNKTISEITFVNPTEDMYMDTITVAEGILCIGANSKFWLFNLSTGTLLKKYEQSGNTNVLSCVSRGNGLIAISSDYLGFELIYDKVSDTLLPSNGCWDRGDAPQTGWYYDPFNNAFAVSRKGSSMLCNHPCYLATINNLNSPVTKTAAQTMKVTYTLTEA